MPIKAIQQFMLGTVMNTESQARETLRLLRISGYQGIELCSFMIHPTGLMVRLLTKAAGMPTGSGGKLDWPKLIGESGLQVVSLHTDLGSAEREPAALAAECKSFGTKYAVITGMYRFAYNDKTAVKDLAARLNKAGAALAEQGIRLLYHNHNCELLRVDGSTRAFDILLEDTDPKYVNFEFDSYWYTDGGADAKEMMRRMGQRMKLWHINDRGTRQTGPAMTPILKTDSMELGTGNMDLDGLTELALQNGVDAVILESHRNWIHKSPVKSFQTSANYLNKHF
ncbi:MAG: sugar phosphate isomerase/epimerase [Blautia sp.]|nr:sugar phosphate isomerase/epimerase [Blautia sp.]